MLSALFAPLAKFLEVEFALNLLLVFYGVVVDPFAILAFETNEMFLRHICIGKR